MLLWVRLGLAEGRTEVEGVRERLRAELALRDTLVREGVPLARAEGVADGHLDRDTLVLGEALSLGVKVRVPLFAGEVVRLPVRRAVVETDVERDRVKGSVRLFERERANVLVTAPERERLSDLVTVPERERVGDTVVLLVAKEVTCRRRNRPTITTRTKILILQQGSAHSGISIMPGFSAQGGGHGPGFFLPFFFF